MAKLRQNLEGRVFSRLTVLDYAKGGWNCLCSCGNLRQVKSSELTAGKVQSCGCLRKDVAGQIARLDIPAGTEYKNSYGTLTLGEEVAQIGQFRMFSVTCFCGTVFTTRLNSLRTSNTRSCGCLLKIANGTRTHGMTGTTTYIRWKSMITRATNPNIAEAKHYSGRGIGVCDRWLDFENFLADMGEIPDKTLTLERKDNDLGYSPENCVWATALVQSRNRKRGGKVYGVRQLPNGRWRACICAISGEGERHLGVFSTRDEAEAARLEAEAIYWK